MICFLSPALRCLSGYKHHTGGDIGSLCSKVARCVVCFLRTSVSILLWIISYEFQNKKIIFLVFKQGGKYGNYCNCCCDKGNLYFLLLSGGELILFPAIFIPLWI
jgi:hypothetical protein